MPSKIPLSGRNGKGKFALVDDDDFEELSQYTWNFNHKKGHITGYAIHYERLSNGRWIGHLMHRRVLDAHPGVHVDHINGNGLDNRKGNLRLATNQENSRNRQSFRGQSPYKGVTLNRKRWAARIVVDEKTIRLGTFDTQTEAAKAYNKAAIEFFGEFAHLNEIPDELPEWDKPHETNTTSLFRGVSRDKVRQKWRAYAVKEGRQIYLGRFSNEIDAAHAYDDFVRQQHLGYPLNFPNE